MKKLISTIVMASGLVSVNLFAEEAKVAEEVASSAVTTQETEVMPVAKSESKLYIGFDALYGLNDFEAGSNNSAGFKMKVGTSFAPTWRVQGYYQYQGYDDSVYLGGSNDSFHELGFDVIKTFDISPKFSPFVQAGLSYGMMDLSNQSESSANAGAIKVGGGATYSLTSNIELLGGVDFQYQDWTDTMIGFDDQDVDATSFIFYVGANYLF
jgi:opacity protein-like surface antigen